MNPGDATPRPDQSTLVKGKTAMKRLQIVGLCAVAMLAASTAVVSSAEALPSWFVKFTCQEKVGTGSYKEGTGGKCSGFDATKKSNFEIVAGTGSEETATGEVNYTTHGGATTLGTGSESVACTEVLGTGHTISFKHVWTKQTFTGCKFAGFKCQNTAKSGEIETKTLEGWLFYIKETAPKEAGIFFTAKEGTVFAEFECATVKVVVASLERTKAEEGESGSCLAGQATPLDTPGTEATVNFEENAEKKQAVRKFKYAGKEVTCELTVSISGGVFKASPVKSSQENIFAEVLEIRV